MRRAGRVARVRGVGHDQLVTGTGHPDVEQAALFAQMGVAAGGDPSEEVVGDAQAGRVGLRREAPSTRPTRKTVGNSRPLALWTVSTATASASSVELDRRRVVARLDQCPQVAGDERAPIVGQQCRLGPDDVEEPGHVLEASSAATPSVAASRASSPEPFRNA